jgi:diaminopimelate decarboxylase
MDIALASLCDISEIFELVKTYKTPLFLFSLDRIKENCSTLKKIANQIFNKWFVAYSFKTNNLGPICKIITDQGFGLEVCSEFELHQAINYCSPKKIVYGGILKSTSSLKFAIDSRIKLINLDSFYEAKILSKLKCDISLGVRIKIAGTKFGFLLEELEKLPVKVSGIHFHIGTALQPREFLKKFYALGIEDFYYQLKEHGSNVTIFDVGGGFLEACYMERNLPKLFKEFKNRLKNLVPEFEIVIEPGRYLVGDAGFVITSVKLLKKNDLILDAGVNILPKIAKANYRFTNITSRESKHLYNLYGPLPANFDVLGRNVLLSKVRRKDIIAIANTGAYAYALKWNFCFPAPKVFFIKNKEIIISQK